MDNKRKIAAVEEGEWAGRPGLHVTDKNATMHNTLAKTCMDIGKVGGPIHVAVRFQPPVAAAASDSFQTVLPHNLGPT